jgi:excisionase family DNA binding protein
MMSFGNHIGVEKRLFNAKEAADYIGTSLLNIYQMVSKNRIPFVKIGRSTRFEKDEIDHWIEEIKKNGRSKTPERQISG